MRDRVSMDELNHDHAQMKADERIKAMEGTLRGVAQEQYIEDLRSLARLEWLGFEDFSPLYPGAETIMEDCRNNVYSDAINDVFVTGVLAKNWHLAGALVITAGTELDDDIQAVADHFELEVAAAIIEERCEARYLKILERVEENWRDYE